MTKAIDFLRGDLDPALIPDEWILERVRNWRNAKLAASDWTQIPDASADKVAWATYRQALRDLPASNSDAQKIELPETP